MVVTVVLRVLSLGRGGRSELWGNGPRCVLVNKLSQRRLVQRSANCTTVGGKCCLHCLLRSLCRVRVFSPLGFVIL